MDNYQLIEKLKLENEEILKKRPDLKYNGDFSSDGRKIRGNREKVADMLKIIERERKTFEIEINTSKGSWLVTHKFLDIYKSWEKN